MSADKKILLIVDDEEDWLFLLKKLLVSEGYGVILERDCVGAMQTMGLIRPDCVIADLQLDGEGGLQLCRFMKTCPALKDIPVIILSGLSQPAAGSGYAAYICKSEGVDRILAAVKKMLSK